MESQIAPLVEKIYQMKAIGEQIAKDYKEIPAVDRNIKRILASLRILELDICDPAQLKKP